MGEEVQKNIKIYTLLKKIEMPFSDYVQIAKSIRGKPYKKGKCNVPKKYQGENFDWNNKGHLVRLSDGLVLTANPKLKGKPRVKKVNGQDIYNGNVSRQGRAFLIKVLHERLSIFIREIEPIIDVKHFPLGIHLNFYVHDKGKNNLDNDNRWVWEKAAQDTLTELKIIPDDNPYIVWENIKRTILIADEKEEKLVLEIYGYA